MSLHEPSNHFLTESCGAGPYRVTVAPSLDTITEWPTVSEVTAGGGYCFQGREFLEIWLQTIGAARRTKAAFVRVCDGCGRPLMLLALGIERVAALRRLVFLDGGVVDYNAPVLLQPAKEIAPLDMAEIWASIVRALPGFDLVVLEKIPQTMNGIPNPLAHLGARPDQRSGHILHLNGTWETYANAALPRRQDSRRKRRQLSEMGPIRLEVAATEAEAARFLSVMVRQKTRRYLDTIGTDDFESPGYRGYFTRMTEQFAARGMVQVAAVFVGDHIVATHWGIVAGRRFHYLMPAFEAGTWSRFSPGRLLIEELIAWSYGNGITVFDFGPGDEPFKVEFRSAIVPLMRLEWPQSAIGRLYSSGVRSRKALGNSPLGPLLKRTRDRLGRGLRG